MMQAGIPIPASEESRLPVFDGIFADIGDEQSIEQTLSTFSWHIGNIIRIINSATENSLVLLDELGISTDPAEGSALARSILLHFLSLGTITVATTHYSDLKAFAHTTDGFKNASLDFDPVTFEPTYHLSVGTPGGSNALATAARLGLPAGIIARAREMTAKGSQELEALLADLMNERQRFSALSDELEKQRSKLEEQNTELTGELKRLRVEEQRIIQEARDGIVKQTAELHREIQQATAELRREKKREMIERGRQALASVQKQLKADDWQPKASTAAGPETADDSRIAPGDTVWLKEVNIAAKVLSLSEETGQVEVQAGQAKLSLSIDRVARTASPAGNGIAASAPVRIEAGGGKASLELDLRGRRADEVEVALDSFLNDAVMANLTEVHIVHGIGGGTVRSIVRESLAAHPLVANFRCGGQKEGGDGVTIVRL